MFDLLAYDARCLADERRAACVERTRLIDARAQYARAITDVPAAVYAAIEEALSITPTRERKARS